MTERESSNPAMQHDECQPMTRRQVCGRSATGIGTAALASLLNPQLHAASAGIAPRAKRIIYLFMHGGPSQMDLFDDKPQLAKLQGT